MENRKTRMTSAYHNKIKNSLKGKANNGEEKKGFKFNRVNKENQKKPFKKFTKRGYKLQTKKYYIGNRPEIRGALEIRDFYEDFDQEIENGMKVVLYVEHSGVFAKQDTLKNFVSRKYENRKERFIVAKKRVDMIPPEKMDYKTNLEIQRRDLDDAYNEFKARYPEAKIDRGFSFNYVIEHSDKTNKSEIMVLAVMYTKPELLRYQVSPIINITNEQYEMLMGRVDTEEGRRVNGILKEELIGNEMFGLIGYLTDGKYTSANLYLETLLDIEPDLEGVNCLRPNYLKYKKYSSTTEKYLSNLVTYEEMMTIREQRRKEKEEKLKEIEESEENETII